MKRELITINREFRHFQFCCGLGGGKQGFNAAQPQVLDRGPALHLRK